ncbi:uncharacterized protein LOC101452817 [Ceratitis capitata]|uniref:uncharacterized protein LOC101452817 n=1 Tax=Ceratitis capitata TaxID=7213 RepID=UPI000A1201B0|nr:uncharacterized protein LOC101452817 [Ceratitis capitata]
MTLKDAPSQGLIAGLKDVSVTIPQAVKRGSNALLICNYDMENDTLYSVKWYKGRREFYRYTPKENPAMKVFPMAAAGLSVERNLSNQSHVVLMTVPLNISGKFTCEISVEAPTFQTAMVSGELEVVELPEEQAIVTGIQPRYRIGDLVDGNCSIKYSKPAANLTWTINGIVVPLHHIKTYQIERYEENNLESVVSALHFMVTTQHFIKGQMRLKCTASIFDIFKEEIESVIEEDRPRIMASGRSYDMHNNYPYEQHASGDGFEDHNESFLTYSAADITSSATTIHTVASASIYAKALKMHWKHIWTGLMATITTIPTSFNRKQRRRQPVVESSHRYVKRISEANVGDGAEGILTATARLDIFAMAERSVVVAIFTVIFAGVFVCTLTLHFISCQRVQKKSVASAMQEQAKMTAGKSATNSIAAFTANVLLSKVTATALAVKWTLKGRKSFHNCIGKNLKSLSVRFVGFLRALGWLKFMQCSATVSANPLQKLARQQQQISRQQQKQQGSTEILRNDAHRSPSNANQQLSLTAGSRSPSTPLPTTLDAALTFDTPSVGAAMHDAIAVCNNTNTNNTRNRCDSGRYNNNNNNSNRSRNNNENSTGGGNSNQAIANFTKDTSKDQTLLMMIAQRFDCQHVDDFLTRALGKWQQLKVLLLSMNDNNKNNNKVLAKAKMFLFNWQENGVTPHHPCRRYC